MLDRLRGLMSPELRNFLDGELAELRAHRRRVGFLLFAMLALTILLIFDGERESPRQTAQSIEEMPSNAEEPKEEAIEEPIERTDRRTAIIGLAKASEGVKLINPFAVDLPKPPPEPLIVQMTAPPPPPRLSVQPTVEKPIEKSEPPLRVALTLQGTAISDDKKFAVVHRRIVRNKDKSEEQVDNQTKSVLLKVGETIEGRKVVDIGRDFVAFDDGERLELNLVNNDD